MKATHITRLRGLRRSFIKKARMWKVADRDAASEIFTLGKRHVEQRFPHYLSPDSPLGRRAVNEFATARTQSRLYDRAARRAGELLKRHEPKRVPSAKRLLAGLERLDRRLRGLRG